AELAVDEADIIIFVVDGQEGITATDQDIAQFLHRSKKPVFVAVNKIDDVNHMDQVYDFYRLGFQHVFAISSIHGAGTGELLDELIHYFPKEDTQSNQEDMIRVSLIGRPNV